jgi:hypothetical protein
MPPQNRGPQTVLPTAPVQPPFAQSVVSVHGLPSGSGGPQAALVDEL